MAKQLFVVVRPVETPPPRIPPRPNLALTLISSPWNTSVCFPKFDAWLTRLPAAAWPNAVGVTSYSPHSWFPPPSGSRASTGTTTQNGVWSAAVIARLSVTVKLPYQVR